MDLRRLVVLGVVFLLAALPGAAVAHGVKEGGTLRLNLSTTDVRSIDPAVDYEYYGWTLEYATCMKLLTYPDRAGAAGTVLVPEAATGLPRVSADGRTYTFTVRPGLRFNTGEPVTAATFAHVLNRILHPKLASPAVPFVADVVGADAVVSGKAATAAGIRARGNTLTVRLTRAAPDFLARMAMNFFCAVPLDTPVPLAARTVPSAGPYYIASWTPNRSVILERNPNYQGSRPHRVERIVVDVNTQLSQSLLQVRAGEADYDLFGVPPTAPSQLARQYGLNRGRFFVHPANAIVYLAINTRRVPDVSVRKAINVAVDRPMIARQAGAFAGKPTDQILPPGLRGFRDVHLYPLVQPAPSRARALLGGRTPKLTLYTLNDPTSQSQAQVIRSNLKAVGIEVTTKPMPFATLVAAVGDPAEPYDLVLIGWVADYPDPVDFINILLDGSTIAESNNTNLALLDDPRFNRRMRAAAGLTGPARYTAYGRLDGDLMREAVPWAPLYVPNWRAFVSERVGCYLFQPAFAAIDLANICLR